MQKPAGGDSGGLFFARFLGSKNPSYRNPLVASKEKSMASKAENKMDRNLTLHARIDYQDHFKTEVSGAKKI